jgi:hypothetical protein
MMSGPIAVALGAEPVTESAVCADHLVGHEQHAVAITDLAELREIALRRHEAPAGVLDGFDEHGSHRLRAFPHDHGLDVGGTAQRAGRGMCTERAPVAVRVGHLARTRHERLEGHPELGQARDGEGAHRRAVVGEVPADDLVAPGFAGETEVLPGELPRGLDGLGAAGREEHPVQIAGGELGQAGRQLDRGGVGVGPDREVAELLRLRARGLGELGTTMADLAHEQSGQAVEVSVALVIPDVAAVAPLDDPRLVDAGLHRGEMTPQMTLRHRRQALLGHRPCSLPDASARLD